ncbi:tRNA (guanine9-N1)-methyltransferase, partial [Lecanoromycetidae sp. Uapishka_2]
MDPKILSNDAPGAGALHPPMTLSKNQQKKLKRDQEWEANREVRKARRKEKNQEKKQSKRAARERVGAIHSADEGPIHETSQPKADPDRRKQFRPQYLQLPVTLLLDCGFDDMMIEKELKSLTAQITRCYSDNHKAPFQTHLAISSFGGRLKERYDGILAGSYRSWRNVRFLEEDFVKAAEQATEWMSGPEGGELAGVFAGDRKAQGKPEEPSQLGEIVYLTSDSPNTLTELRPQSTYVVGGLVDRNRHKGVCYKSAMDRGIKTAKLPIGDYMKMNSRFVLATNHVVEIMLRWLEHGDWGKAFDMVIPKRKGGVLKEDHGKATGKVDDPEDSNDGDEKSDVDEPAVEPQMTAENGAGAEDSRGLEELHVKGPNEINRAAEFGDGSPQTILSNTRTKVEGSDGDAEKIRPLKVTDLSITHDTDDAIGNAEDDAQTVSIRAGHGGSDTEEALVPSSSTESKGRKRTADFTENGKGVGSSKKAKCISGG